jgi:hypothetical protein
MNIIRVDFCIDGFNALPFAQFPQYANGSFFSQQKNMRLYFGANTIWYLQFHFECNKLLISFIPIMNEPSFSFLSLQLTDRIQSGTRQEEPFLFKPLRFFGIQKSSRCQGFRCLDQIFCTLIYTFTASISNRAPPSY